MSDRPNTGGSVLSLLRRQRLTREGPEEAWTGASFGVLREPAHGGNGGNGGEGMSFGLLRGPTHGGNGTEALEPRVAKLQADAGHVLRDVAEARADLRTVGKEVSDIKMALAGLTDRVGHLATSGTVLGIKADVAAQRERSARCATTSDVSEAKRFVLWLALGSLAVILALVTLAPQLQQWAGTAPPPVISAPSTPPLPDQIP